MADQTPAPTDGGTPPADPGPGVTPPADPASGPAVGEVGGGDALAAIIDQLNQLAATATNYRQGVVTAITPNLQVSLGQSAVSYTNVSMIDGIDISVGDTVACIVMGNDMLVLGPMTTVVHGGIPSGFIGATWATSAPAGWLVANGSPIPPQYADLIAICGPNTPDLRDKFIMGSGTAAPHSTGGLASVVLTTAQMPAHTHTGAAHTHTTPAHTHAAGTLATNTVGDHSHVLQRSNVAASASGADTSTVYRALGGSGTTYTTTQPAGGHSHTLSGSTATSAAGVTGSDGADPTTSTGGGTAHENRPPYVACLPIIKT